MLMTETNTPEMSERIIRAAKFILGNGCYKTDFEHGQWWVTRPGALQAMVCSGLSDTGRSRLSGF